jgi:hemolysin activation/secretion protein
MMQASHPRFVRQVFLAGSLYLSATAMSSALCWAQFTPQVQQNYQQSGAIIQHLDDSMTGKPAKIKPAELDSVAKPTAPTPAIENKVPEPRLDDSLKRKLMINKIQVDGYKILTQNEVNAITAPYLHKESSFLELQENVADKLTALYEKKGYITSLAFIPPQTIDNGVIKIKVDEGRISKITLAGTHWFKPVAVLPHVSAKVGQPFNVKPLQASLRRLNENPDLTLQATLKAGKNPGDTEIVLSPRHESFFAHLTPFIDNLGRPVIGNTRYGMTISNNNTTGLGDTSFSSPYWTKHSFGIINGYELPLGSHGTKLGFANAHTQFQFHQSGFRLNGNSNINTPYISQEFFRNEKAVISGELGLAIKNSDFQVDKQLISQDKLRVLTSALNVQTFDKWGRNYMRHELGLGLNMTDATQKNSALATRPGTSGKFFRYTASVSRLQRLPFGTYGILKAQGQATPDRLFSLEQMQIGGSATVRGYQEGRLIGDKGFVASAEWRIPLHFLPDTMKFGRYKLNQNLELVTFFDAGGVMDNHAFAGVNSQSGKLQKRGYLMGTGVGIRAKLTRFVAARIDVGFPLIKQDPDKDSARVHFGVESRLF